MLRASLDAAIATMPEPDVVFVLGDLVTHDAPNLEFDRAVFQNTSALVAQKFHNRSTRACQVPLGNNDVYPNYYTDQNAPEQYRFQAEIAKLHCGLDDATADVFAANGYYNVTLRGGRAKVLILNTNALANANALGVGHKAVNVTDPFGQFAWMDAQFADAESRDMVVHIQAHIAPALTAWAQPCLAATLHRALLADRRKVGACPRRPSLWPLALTRGASCWRGASSALAAAPAMQPLLALAVYRNNPVFYTAELGAETLRVERFESYTLNLATVGDYPVFVEDDMIHPDGGMSNQGWSEMIESWHDPTSSVADKSFRAFFHQYKAGFHGTEGCEAVTSTFDRCATCTLGCRTAFACLSAHGRDVSDYEACIETHGYSL